MAKGDENDERMSLAEARQIALGLSKRQRLAAAAWTFDGLRESWSRGGTYRYLVYKSLGFGPVAYSLLLEAGAEEVNNELSTRRPDQSN
jgi:hypothetical protein